MYFIHKHGDRSGSIIQVMIFTVAYCEMMNIKYDGLIGHRMWWNNVKFFEYVRRVFGINNSVIDVNKLKCIQLSQISDFVGKDSSNIGVDLDFKFIISKIDSNINVNLSKDFRLKIHKGCLNIKRDNLKKII